VASDLVGELVELRERHSPWESRSNSAPYWTTYAEGRVRAVTANEHGHLTLWLEVVGPGNDIRHHDAEPGDVYAASLYRDGAVMIRIKRGAEATR
jgi:hypothetical protein